MNGKFFIEVEDSRNHISEFNDFMQATVEILKTESREYLLKRNGDKLEQDVLACMKSKANEFHFNPDLIRHTPVQHFPDIISNNYYGVEVKSTKNNSWKSTGSSIVESLRDENIKKVFMFFGILSEENIDFRCKPYEQCLSDIAVTHSPRYLIDMDLQPNATIFDKMGEEYDAFRISNTQIETVRKYYKKKYKSRDIKSMPWWIGDDNDEQSNLNNFELQLFSDLDNEKKSFLKGRCYALFPEIFGTEQDKFRKPVLWMCTKYSIICSNLRDIFSAGGQCDIYVNNKLKYKKIPKIICNVLPYIQNIKEWYREKTELHTDFDNFSNVPEMKFENWCMVAQSYINKTTASYIMNFEELCNYKFIEKKSNAFYLCE